MGLADMSLIISCFTIVIHVFLFTCSSLLLHGFTTIATFKLGNETDRLALLEFKAKITQDPLRVLSSWNDSTHFCNWQGVTCSHHHQRVTALYLRSLTLGGTLSPYIGNLSFLRHLDLRNNSFRNEIPQEISHLSRLRYLGLSNNSFGGEIPGNISSCSNLQILLLGYNKLIGEVPSEFGSLSKLSKLTIHVNDLLGEIPHSFGNLSNLLTLSAAGNNFKGSIPTSLSQLKRITYLAFGKNKLSGTIPPSIFNMSSLVLLAVEDNQLHGSLPSNLGFTLPNLEVIGVAKNQFTGPIPASIANASNLRELAIPINKFSGRVPSLEKLHSLRFVIISENRLGNGENDDLDFLSSLINCTRLELLGIAVNNFGGILPGVIGNFSTHLNRMVLSDNQIFGSIPTSIENLVNLEVLYLGVNQFTGSIPTAIGKLQNLKVLNLDRNKFSGNIPFSLGNLTLLTHLSLRENNLGGSIPSTLGKCQSLLALDLSHNNLSSTIPPQIIGISSLSILLNLSQNHLTGSLPMEVGNLKFLGVLDISENMLSGEIPSSLGSCVSLEQLIMKDNFFQGSLPPSLSSLRSIQYLDLSQNNLSGQLPIYLQNYSMLQKLNISFNDFEGDVPIGGLFKNASAISVDGNHKLCGGIAELNLSTCTINGSKNHRRSVWLTLIIPIVSGILVLTLILAFIFLCWLRMKRKRNSSSESSLLTSLLQVSYDNLLKATGGFSSGNLIGMGSFGSVYKGILDRSGTTVAVKVLNLQRQGAFKSFMAECEALRSIRHRNLLKILTVCSSVDFQGNDFKALVYEFMVNGSLEEWLHPNPSSAYETPRKLNLIQRLNIATDVACALDYLHHHCQMPIVHCDLKPSNVLLDSKITGQVGDFGLARILSEATHNLSTNQTSSVGARGTVGYIAPEYGMGSELSTYGDVYSYGILLLEMFTAKRPTDELFKDSLTLHNFVKEALPNRVAEIVDPILLQEGEEEETNANNTCSQRILKIQECWISIFGVGIACSAELARERMNISDVVVELHSIKNIFLGTRVHRERRL